MEAKRKIAEQLADYYVDHLCDVARVALNDRAKAMMYNAAMLVLACDEAMAGNILRCYKDLEFAKESLAKVRDRAVYDYWTQEVPSFMRSRNAQQLVEIFNKEFIRMAQTVVAPPQTLLPRFVELLLEK